MAETGEGDAVDESGERAADLVLMGPLALVRPL